MGNPLVWVLLNNWRLGRVGNTNFSRNVSNKMLLNAANSLQILLFLSYYGKADKGGGGEAPPR